MNSYDDGKVTLFATQTDYDGDKNDISDSIQYGKDIVLTKRNGIMCDVYFQELTGGTETDKLRVDIYRKSMVPFESGKEIYVRRVNCGNYGVAEGEKIVSFGIAYWIDLPGCYSFGVYADGGTDNFSCKIIGRYF